MTNRRNRQRAGLTLIELLASLAIVSVVAVASLSVATRLAKSAAHDRTASRYERTAAALSRLIELDLAHAEGYRITDEGIELAARAALDPATRAVDHVPARVTYAVRLVAETPWLVRIQRIGSGEPTAEPVCSGVTALSIRPAGEDAKPPAEGQLAPMPEEADVLAVFTCGARDNDRPILRFRK